MKNSLIFDLDGTLWNTKKACVTAWNITIKEFKIHRPPITGDNISSMMGLTTEEMRLKFFSELDQILGNRLLQECFSQEINEIKKHTSLCYPGVLESLSKLSNNFNLYIVSNCEEGYLKLFLEETKAKNTFKDVDCYGRTQLPKGKTIKQLMIRNKLKAENTIYIGDTPHDQIASEFANIPFYFLEYGFGKVNNPSKSFENFFQLSDFLIKGFKNV